MRPGRAGVVVSAVAGKCSPQRVAGLQRVQQGHVVRHGKGVLFARHRIGFRPQDATTECCLQGADGWGRLKGPAELLRV